MSAIEVLFLSKEDVDSLELSLEDMLAAVEMGLDAHGRKDVLRPSKDHIPLGWPQNIFNILCLLPMKPSSKRLRIACDFRIPANAGVRRVGFRLRRVPSCGNFLE